MVGCKTYSNPGETPEVRGAHYLQHVEYCSVPTNNAVNRRPGERHPEHKELVVVVQSSIVRLAQGDPLSGDEIVVGL